MTTTRLISVLVFLIISLYSNLLSDNPDREKSNPTYAGRISPITDYLQFFDSRSHPEFDTDKLQPKSNSYTHQKLNGYDSSRKTPGGLILKLCHSRDGKKYQDSDFSPKRLLKSVFYRLTGFKEEDLCKVLVDYDEGKLQLKLSLGWR
jgi:hypothetical protein